MCIYRERNESATLFNSMYASVFLNKLEANIAHLAKCAHKCNSVRGHNYQASCAMFVPGLVKQDRSQAVFETRVLYLSLGFQELHCQRFYPTGNLIFDYKSVCLMLSGASRFVI